MNKNIHTSETANINTLPVHTRATIIASVIIDDNGFSVNQAGKKTKRGRFETFNDQTLYGNRQMLENIVTQYLNRFDKVEFFGGNGDLLIRY